MTKDFIVKEGRFGKALFANCLFSKGEKIFDFSGPYVKRSEISDEDIIAPEDDRFIQVDKDLYIGPSGDVDDWANHSCEPNAAVRIAGRKAPLVALEEIHKGDEVTFDYSIHMHDEPWTMKCECGSKKCRSIIREYRYLPQREKDRYLKLGLAPAYNIGL